MGNASSIQEEEEEKMGDDSWWNPQPSGSVTPQQDLVSQHDAAEARPEASASTSMEEFRAELSKKRDARREILAERNREMNSLRHQLAEKTLQNEQLQLLHQATGDEGADNLAERNRQLMKELAAAHLELQEANVQIAGFEQERTEYREHVAAMKEVVRVSKQMLQLRETQLEELKTKIAEIEATVAEREASMLSSNLRAEYEKQLRNIRALRTLYEQRQAATRAERDAANSRLADTEVALRNAETRTTELEDRTRQLEQDVSQKYDDISSLQSQLGLARAEGRGLQQELSVINQMFSQVLGGCNGCPEVVDLDRLVGLLEENHGLLAEMVERDETDSAAALPRVLLDLISRSREDGGGGGGGSGPTAAATQINSAAQIVDNLPKVWRVLVELLSQQAAGAQQHTDDAPTATTDPPCYKSVDTPRGPKLVLSVSKTFIRLKELILEKKSLEKEMTRLKQLNVHLEVRLQDQERRLEAVSGELSNTWHVVGKMQKQHQQLHTHEQILRYELAQKRKLLNELKQELEYCRQKWVEARAKNTTTEEQWQHLRAEFTQRKKGAPLETVAVTDTTLEDPSNSAESGYSDEREGSSDDDDDDEEQVAPLHTSTSVQETDADLTHQDTSDVVDLEPGPSTSTILPDMQSGFEPSSNASVTTVDPDLPGTSKQCEETPSQPPTPSDSKEKRKTETQDEVLTRREARLKRLEEQCQQLVAKVTNTSHRSHQICSKLTSLHEQYGGNASNQAAENDEAEASPSPPPTSSQDEGN